jgi:hypothetical protein
VPPRGWWAKKAAGKRVKQEPLPPIQKGQYATIQIEGQKQNAPEESRDEAPPAREIVFERDPVNAIVVEPEARLTHPLIRDAAAGLRSRQADRDGIVTPRRAA